VAPTTVEHRLLRRADPEPTGLTLMHWNLSERAAGREAAFAGIITNRDADVTVLTNAGAVPWHEDVTTWLDGARPVHRGTFAILTRLPVVESRWLIAEEGVTVALLRLAPPEEAEPIVIFLVDLPSDPRLPRREVARRLRALLDEIGAPAPDVVVGDLNITRGSASLRRMFPAHHHAYADGGHGYAASFPRDVPIYHLDHILLGADRHCTRYDLPDVAVGRHRPQVAWIEPRP
jgi:endonuclease/exonuclease/phosphatase family metal-dependent hydrolase